MGLRVASDAVQVRNLVAPTLATIQAAIAEFRPNILYIWAGAAASSDAATAPLQSIVLEGQDELLPEDLPELVASHDIHALVLNMVSEGIPVSEIRMHVPNVVSWNPGMTSLCSLLLVLSGVHGTDLEHCACGTWPSTAVSLHIPPPTPCITTVSHHTHPVLSACAAHDVSALNAATFARTLFGLLRYTCATFAEAFAMANHVLRALACADTGAKRDPFFPILDCAEPPELPGSKPLPVPQLPGVDLSLGFSRSVPGMTPLLPLRPHDTRVQHTCCCSAARLFSVRLMKHSTLELPPASLPRPPHCPASPFSLAVQQRPGLRSTWC